MITLFCADTASAYPPSNYAGAIHVAVEKNRESYSDSDDNNGNSHQPPVYDKTMIYEPPDMTSQSCMQDQKRSFYVHPTTAEEFEAWLQGYEKSGGNPETFSGTNLSEGWYTIERDFCMYINDWQIDGDTMGDGKVRNILVPDNITFLGGAVGSDMHLYLMKDFSIVSDTPSAFTHRTTPQEFERWLSGYAAKNDHPERFDKTDLSDGWYTIEKDFDTSVTCDVTFINLHQAYLGKEHIRWIRDGSIKHLLVPPDINYTGGEIGNDIEIYLMNESLLIGERTTPGTTEIIQTPTLVEEAPKEESNHSTSDWAYYRDKIKQYLSYL